LQVVAHRGSLPPGPITDPLIARFQEIATSYGTTFKAVIEEEFGDRVVVTLDGKFLPFRTW